ncbi:MAG: cell division protein FtsW [Ruminococcaceae bacterium]|nr:cell division protein FtsW [Oscillospiraceae bacterium]
MNGEQDPKKKGFSFKNIGKKIDKTLDRVSHKADRLGDRWDEKLAENDPLFTQPIHGPAEDTQPRVLVKGGIDLPFLFIVIALTVFGAVMAYSASSVYADQYHGDSAYYVKRHIIYLIIGVVASIPFVLKAQPWFWRLFGVASYAASVVLLLMVLIIGSSYGSGATRWIQLGPVSIQPSEIAKMAVIMVIALEMTKYESRLKNEQKFGGHLRYGVIYPMLIFGTICVLVMLERHLSGIIIIGLLGLTTMYLGGTKGKYFLWIIGICVVGVLAVLLVSDYAQARVTTWLFIDKVDPLGSAWQTLQGLNAIGSGGFFGKGLGNSQQKYGYVSQPQNDFIFTIVCEELGFVGAVCVVVLFALLVWRGFRIAAKAPDKFCSIVVYGLVIKVALQTILNIAVVTNSMPNTGIALPFFSSGGTAIILQLFEMGIILAISRYSYQKR